MKVLESRFRDIKHLRGKGLYEWQQSGGGQGHAPTVYYKCLKYQAGCLQMGKVELGMVAHSCSNSTLEVEAGG